MKTTTQIQCACGNTRLEVTGTPIATVECCCSSCREAAARMQKLDGAPTILTDYDATPFVMVRKDRVRLLAGQPTLKTFRLTPKSTTQRAIATCCNSPIYLDFKGGHWLSLYAQLWPTDSRPAPQMRTMTSDLPAGATLPNDIPNLKKQSLGFFAKLLTAWISMGFRVPKMPATEEIDI